MTVHGQATLPGNNMVVDEHSRLINKRIKPRKRSVTPRPGRIAVFSGHMIDAPGRPTPRFPAALEEDVRAAIVEALIRLDISCGYAAAACGADMLFLESLLERGAQAHIILPFQTTDFLHASVAFAGANWVERFHRVLAEAATVRYAVDEAYLGDDGLFEYHSTLSKGIALLHAARLQTEVVALAVCDLTSATLIGGTRATLEAWRQAGGMIEVIALDALRTRRSWAPTLVPPARHVAPSPQTAPPTTPCLRRTIKSMLCVHLGGARQGVAMESSPYAVMDALGQIARHIGNMGKQPIVQNTWGDSVLLVFDELGAAAECAWHLLHAMPQAHLRLGLHAGPIFIGTDPITDQANVFGSPVSLATDLAACTPPHTVYMSEPFLALWMTTAPAGCTYDYVGELPLAAGPARHPVYRLRHLSTITLPNTPL